MRNRPWFLIVVIIAMGWLPVRLTAAEAPTSAPAKPVHFDVRAYGATGNGTTPDTDAINAAIAAAAGAGGGTVYFPAGTFASYSIHLKSNVTLYLDQGATLLAAGPELGGLPGPRDMMRPATRGGARRGGRGPASSTAPGAANAYDAPEPNEWTAFQDFGHSHFQNSLIWGENLHDISILGPGTIDGRGLAYNPPANARGVGNKALALKLCRNITIRDVTFFRGGHFVLLATGVDNLTIDNVKVDTIRDGFDIDSCRNVRISNCLINSPIDDAICLKADYALGAARACENVAITNCHVSGYVMGTMLDGTLDRSVTLVEDGDGPCGRIKLGTESNGDFRNIAISNCVFDHCRGLGIMSVDGGTIEDLTVSNLTMRDINSSPIFIRLGNRARGPADKTGVARVRRINISDITASGCDSRFPVLVAGLPDHPVEDVRISNVRIVYAGGGTAEQAARNIPEVEKAYPEPSMFGVLPAAAVYARHVKGLQMHHIDVTFDTTDARPAVVLSDVAGADFDHVNLQRFDGVPLFSLAKVTNLSVQSAKGLTDLHRDAVENELVGK